MLRLKKTGLTVLMLIGNLVYAGSMGPVCTPIDVTVPCESTYWDFSGEALYVRPGFVGNEFLGIIENSEQTLGVYKEVPRDWSWGYKLEGAFHFGMGSDLDLNWFHMDHKNAASYAGSLALAKTNYTVGNPYVTNTPRWDAVNLEFGQHVDFGKQYNVRFYGGLSFADIQDTVQIIAQTQVDPLAPNYQSINYGFVAVGIRSGAKLAYNWTNGFSFYANTALAMFAGSKSYNYRSSPNPPATTADYRAVAHVSAVVPTLEGRTGIQYTYPLARGKLTVDGGWMWINYFQPIAVLASDFALQGAYFGLRWVGDAI